jgi:hypothetical protein
LATHVTLEDGRVLGTANGTFDGILEAVAQHLGQRAGGVEGLADWLLEQRCAVQGPGVGYLDLRELAPQAVQQFRDAVRVLAVLDASDNVPSWLYPTLASLLEMWRSMDRGESPEACTSSAWLISPPTGSRRGPGW